MSRFLFCFVLFCFFLPVQVNFYVNLTVVICKKKLRLGFLKNLEQFCDFQKEREIDQAALTQHHFFYLLMTAEVASLIRLVVS